MRVIELVLGETRLVMGSRLSQSHDGSPLRRGWARFLGAGGTREFRLAGSSGLEAVLAGWQFRLGGLELRWVESGISVGGIAGAIRIG